MKIKKKEAAETQAWIVKMPYGCEPHHCNVEDCNNWATCKGRNPFDEAKKAAEIKPFTHRSVAKDLSTYVILGKPVIFYAVERE